MRHRLVRWIDVTGFLALAGVAVCLRPHELPWFAGLGLSIVSFPLWMLARRQLRTVFSFRPEARQLVTHGLYSKIRHPIYVFGTAAFFGVMLALQIWPLFALWLALTPIARRQLLLPGRSNCRRSPIELVRIRREERVLRATFGERYEHYRRSTWF